MVRSEPDGSNANETSANLQGRCGGKGIKKITFSPFKLTAKITGTGKSGLTNYPTGMILDSISSSCSLDVAGTYRCRHSAFFQSTGACRWDGNHKMALSYACDPTNTCDLCNGSTDVDFSLESENFCSVTTVFRVADLSCPEAIARSSAGGVPCCSETYTPLVSCLAAHCASLCLAAVNATGGIDPDDDPCYSCVFYYCDDQYFACVADNHECTAP